MALDEEPAEVVGPIGPADAAIGPAPVLPAPGGLAAGLDVDVMPTALPGPGTGALELNRAENVLAAQDGPLAPVELPDPMSALAEAQAAVAADGGADSHALPNGRSDAAGTLPPTPLSPNPVPPTRKARRRSRTSPDRVQRSFYLSRELVDRARAAVLATMAQPGEAYNVSQLAGRGLEAEVQRLEDRYNGGQPFPPVSHVPSGPSPAGVERIRAGVTVPRRRQG